MLLAKVEKSDQYYRETKVLIEKINNEKTRVDLESLSQKINLQVDKLETVKNSIDSAAVQVNEDEMNLTDNNINSYKPLQNLISQFEYQYKAAETPGSITKKENLRIMDSLYVYQVNSNLTRKRCCFD